MVDGVKGSGSFNAQTVLKDLLKKSGGGSTIKADVWNEYAQSHGGNKIKKFINTSDAIASINAYQAREEVIANLKFEASKLEMPEIDPDGKPITPGDEIKLEDINKSSVLAGAFSVEGNDEVGGAVLKAKEEIAAPEPKREEERIPRKLTTAQEKDMNGRHAQLLAKFPEGHPVHDQILRGINDERANAGLPPIALDESKSETTPTPITANNQPTTKTAAFTVEGNDEVGGAVLKAKEEIAAPPPKQEEEKVPYVKPEIQEMETKHQQVIENINKLPPEKRARVAARLYGAMNRERAAHPEYNMPPLKNPYENTDS